MKRKELTKTFMMISNGKNLGFYGLHKNVSTYYGLRPSLGDLSYLIPWLCLGIK